MKPLLETDCVNLLSCTFIWYCLLCGKNKTLKCGHPSENLSGFHVQCSEKEILGLYIQFKLVTLQPVPGSPSVDDRKSGRATSGIDAIYLI